MADGSSTYEMFWSSKEEMTKLDNPYETVRKKNCSLVSPSVCLLRQCSEVAVFVWIFVLKIVFLIFILCTSFSLI